MSMSCTDGMFSASDEACDESPAFAMLAARVAALEDAAGGESRAEASAAVDVVAVAAKDEAEDGAREAALVEALSSVTSDDYYSWTTAALLDVGVPGAYAAAHGAAAMAVMACVMLALLGIVDFAWVTMVWDDDEVFGWGNRAEPTYFSYIYQVQWFGCPAATVVTVALCSVLIVLEIRRQEFGAMQTTRLLVGYELLALLDPRGDAGGRRRPPLWRLGLAYVVSTCRSLQLTVFVYSSCFVLGTSDGPAQVILNSLASIFLLGVDDALNMETVAGLDALHSHADAVDQAAVWRPVAARLLGPGGPAPGDRRRALERGTLFLEAVTLVILAWSAVAMQKRTSAGEGFYYDDGEGTADLGLTPAGGDNHVTLLIRSMLFVYLIVLAFHAAVLVPLAVRDGPARAVGPRAEIDRRFGGSRPNFRTLELNQIEVDSADFWTNRLLSSSSRSTAEEIASKRSHTRTLKSG